MSRVSVQKQPVESVRVRLHSPLPSKMKAVTLLLATAVALAYGTPNQHLKSIIYHVRCLHQKTQNTVRLSVS